VAAVFLNQTTTNQKMEFVVGDYRGGRATAVDGVRGGVLACLGRRYRQRKNKKIQYVVALDGRQTMTNITTNQMYAGATNEEKDTMNESRGERGGRAIPSFWGDRIKWM
jgi:hypothetical protein